MNLIKSDNKWYLIGIQPNKSINQTIQELSDGTFRAKFAYISLGNIKQNTNNETNNNESYDATPLDNPSNSLTDPVKHCIMYNADNPFRKSDWGVVKNLDEPLFNQDNNNEIDIAAWVLTEQFITVPDQDFRTYLEKQHGIIFDSKNTTPRSSLNNVTEIDVNYSSDIEDLTGIEGFFNLTHLSCGYTYIRELNVNNCVKLKHIYAANCIYLTQLDVTSCVDLEFLDCSLTDKNSEDWPIDDVPGNMQGAGPNVGLKNLYVNNLTKLETLYADRNRLEYLDLRNCHNLSTLTLNNNRFTGNGVNIIITTFTEYNHLTVCTTLPQGPNNELRPKGNFFMVFDQVAVNYFNYTFPFNDDYIDNDDLAKYFYESEPESPP